ncbi:MAG: SUMF1/EgtB/PvdO family nonheme iron enzyme [Planctomycetota bacterium]|nr:SUMF1/EgtB/PvdO family nonheme iron enzyme [Planctomycetota bacterium]
MSRRDNARYVIPTEDEWYKAAYYKGGSRNAGYWDYPTQSNTRPGQDMTDASGNNANYWPAPYMGPIDSGRWITVAGEFQNSPSPYGTFDQGGNVWEWNEATFFGSYRLARGGCFAPYDDLPASDRQSGGPPTFEDGAIGFRIAYVPEPGSIALFALGGLAVLRRRTLTRPG